MMEDVLALILCGGKGERLFPLTRDRAKLAVPFAGVYRLIDFTLSNCINSGLRKIAVLTQYKSASLERHLRMGWNIFSEEIGDFIVFLPPQKRVHDDWYRGTADAVYQNIYFIDKIMPAEILILSGDHVYAMDYRDMLHFHRARGAELSVGAIPVNANQAHQFGVIRTDKDGQIVSFQEKPPLTSGKPLASMGVYIFNRETLYRQLEEDAFRNRVQIDAYATVRESIIMEGVKIGSGARIRRAIIHKSVNIPPGIDIGYDPVRDREQFPVSETGIVIIPRGEKVSFIQDEFNYYPALIK